MNHWSEISFTVKGVAHISEKKLNLTIKMKESCQFQIPLKNGKWNEEEFKDSIIQLLVRYKKELGIMLSYYYKDVGGLVEEVKLDSQITFTSPTSGYFKVSFDVVHFNACLDIHQLNQDCMILHMDLISHTNNIKITGPLWPEREPDEI